MKSLYSLFELHTGNTLFLLELIENNLQDALSERVSLLKIEKLLLDSAEVIIKWKRIKTFTCNTMGQQRLNALAMLSVENKLIHGLVEIVKLFFPRNPFEFRMLLFSLEQSLNEITISFTITTFTITIGLVNSLVEGSVTPISNIRATYFSKTGSNFC